MQEEEEEEEASGRERLAPLPLLEAGSQASCPSSHSPAALPTPGLGGPSWVTVQVSRSQVSPACPAHTHRPLCPTGFLWGVQLPTRPRSRGRPRHHPASHPPRLAHSPHPYLFLLVPVDAAVNIVDLLQITGVSC